MLTVRVLIRCVRAKPYKSIIHDSVEVDVARGPRQKGRKHGGFDLAASAFEAPFTSL